MSYKGKTNEIVVEKEVRNEQYGLMRELFHGLSINPELFKRIQIFP